MGVVNDFKCSECGYEFESKEEFGVREILCKDCGGKAVLEISTPVFAETLIVLNAKGRFSELKDNLAIQKENREAKRKQAGEIRKKGGVHDI
jgi:DNA-directed RNA polymerase subunit RPC12/RpoP